MQKSEFKQKIKGAITDPRVRKVLVGVLCAIIALCLLRLLLLVFPIRNFEIKGDTDYEVNEILDVAGIRSGKSLYGINVGKAEKRILEGCPHIKSVNIKRKFPATVIIEVEERVPGWYISVGEDFFALDYDMRIILETRDEQTLTERGLTRLVLPELESAIVGEFPTFGKGDELLIRETLRIVDSLRTHRLKSRLTQVDLTNRFEIKLTVDTTFAVNFGDMVEADTKLEMIEGIVNKSIAAGYAGGEINVIDPLAHSFRGYYPDADASKTDVEDAE